MSASKIKRPKIIQRWAENHQNLPILPDFDLILPLEIWMRTKFGHLANFDPGNVYMYGKCLT